MSIRMDRALVASLFASLLLAIVAPGCKKNKPLNYGQELPPGQMALRKISPDEYPDFSKCTWNLGMLPRSIDASLLYMSKPSSKQYYPYLDITHDRAVASLRAMRELVNQAGGMDRAAAGPFIDKQIRENFEVYKSIGAPNPDGPGYTDRVLFTGYCTPDREASLTRTGPFQYPLHKRPADLVSDQTTGETVGRKLPDGTIAPYWTRAEIETQNKLAGNELVWLKSRWEAYIVTVQGSARLKLTDGRIMEIGYAGHNGYEYTSPGKQMVAEGAITKDQLSLKGMTAYFAAHPEAMDKYLSANKRTVFFMDRPGGPFGKLNVPVTTFATIATDKEVYPRAMPAFLDVPVPVSGDSEKKFLFNGFMMDQDAGGAIRAAGRCDIYMGIGNEAEAKAGHQYNEGALYYVALKPELVSKYTQAGQ